MRTLRYGEAITVVCRDRSCTFEENGVKFEVNQSALSIVEAPGPTLYALGPAEVYDQPEGGRVLRRLKEGSRVEAVSFRPILGGRSPSRVAIGENQWVSVTDLRDKPETVKDRQARKAYEAREEQRAREAARAEVVAAADQRRSYAASLRNHFLDQGADVKVRVSGPKVDRLTLEYVLFNDVWSRKMETGTLLGEIRDQGFKRFDMQSGYGWHVYWDWR